MGPYATRLTVTIDFRRDSRSTLIDSENLDRRNLCARLSARIASIGTGAGSTASRGREGAATDGAIRGLEIGPVGFHIPVLDSELDLDNGSDSFFHTCSWPSAPNSRPKSPEIFIFVRRRRPPTAIRGGRRRQSVGLPSCRGRRAPPAVASVAFPAPMSAVVRLWEAQHTSLSSVKLLVTHRRHRCRRLHLCCRYRPRPWRSTLRL